MRWAVVGLIVLSVACLIVLGLLLWRLWRLVKEFARTLGRAGTEFAQIASVLEQASDELRERPGVD
jgi:hypothetical protein